MNEEIPIHPRRSFFNVAAWLSVLIPFCTLTLILAIWFLSDRGLVFSRPSRQFTATVYGSAFWVCFIGCVSAIVSLFGMRRHGAIFILCKALPGLFASGLLGFWSFMMVMMSSIVC